MRPAVLAVPLLAALLFVTLLVAQPPVPPPKPEKPSSSGEEQTVKAAYLPTTGPGLVEFFKKRSKRSSEAGAVQELIKQLGDKDAETRDRAAGGLVQLGSLAVPLLRQAAAAVDDAEVSTRAKECLKLIESEEGATLIASAARLLVEKNPEGGVEALLAYLPAADNLKVAQEVELALIDLATRDGKLHPALVKGLKDSAPGVRAVAASVIGQVGDVTAREGVKALLKDSRPVVRLRAALGLARRSDADAMPVLFELMGELPDEYRLQVEEYLTDLAGEWKVELPEGKTPLLQKLRREVWAGWWKGTDGKNILEEVRRRTLSDEDRDKVQALIRDMGKDTERERQQAMLALINFGPKAMPLLRQAADGPFSKVNEGARRCLEQLKKDGAEPLPPVALRLLALHRPEGGGEALLNYVPFADSELLSEALSQVLPDLVASKDGKIEPAFLKALSDSVKSRRLAAIEALAQYGGQQEALKKLLTEKDPEVRMRTALALARAGERDVIPTLIGIVSDSPPELAWQGDEYLARVAGSKKPAVSPGKDEEGKKKYREQWSAWWKENANQVVLTERVGSQRLLGHTLVVEQYNQFTGNGRVFEMDGAGTVRWEINTLATPMDARVVGDRVLIAEQNANRVTERDFKGEVKWEKQVPQPIICERLKNGHVFIVRRNGILEVDREGREVYHIQRNSDHLMGGGRLRDGSVAFVNNNNPPLYVRLDREGRELKSFRGPQDPTGNGIFPWILPNGHVLLSYSGQHKVIELDREGKTVWEGSVQWPHLATRLPNGNTLVCSINNRKITELSRSGKVVKETTGNYQPYKAERR